MPRNKILLKGRGGAASGNKKVVIRPYQKPPTLPPNYYEKTVADLMTLTFSVLDQKRSAGFGSMRSSSLSSNALSAFQEHAPKGAGEGTSPPLNLSLQNAYTAVVHLVSHQFGTQLYHDLRSSMQKACEKVLPDDTASRAATDSGGDESSDHALLELIPFLYQSYTEYLLCVKHVFLPLDRTHVWQADTQQVLTIRGPSGPLSSSSNSKPLPSEFGGDTFSDANGSSFSPHAQQNLWQMGLSVWAERLSKLGIEKVLYRSWLHSLLDEWNPPKIGSTGDNIVGKLSGRHNPQSVWYMWQDLGLLAVLPIQQDLEDYWRGESLSWEAEIPYRPVQFVSFCFHKHKHIHRWPWLPSGWLMSILEQCLLLPHLLKAEDEGTASGAFKRKLPPPGLLLQPSNFNPLLEEALFGGGFIAIAPKSQGNEQGQSTISQLWLLAGRLPNGQPAVAHAIAQFARTLGLQRVKGLANTHSKSTIAVEKKKEPPATGALSQVSTIGDLLKLQDALSNLIRSLPHGSDLINLKNVWEEVTNQDTKPSVAESLAKFLDQILRNNKKMDQYQQESDTWLGKIISGVFVPLQAKDVFEAFYKKDLAKRLLWNRVVSMDVEKQVCSMLKAECGAAYTSKMEGMFQDVDWSRETMMVYKQSQSGHGAVTSSVEMEVQVLTTGYWPVYPQFPNLQLPYALSHQQEQFTTHYKTKYQGRRMNWQYALGHCLVKCSGFGRQYELVVSLCQALVLIQFETTSKWKLPDLMKAVGLEDRSEMERVLQSLSVGKEGTRILHKADPDTDPAKKKKVRMNVEDFDVFSINEGFESNQRRIRINNIMMKETKEERDKTVEAVSRDRLYLIDAVLVRILKARKTILHHALIPEVLEQVKVPAQPADVKKRIESLIEREYMERDPKDRSRYNYLA